MHCMHAGEEDTLVLLSISLINAKDIILYVQQQVTIVNLLIIRALCFVWNMQETLVIGGEGYGVMFVMMNPYL